MKAAGPQPVVLVQRRACQRHSDTSGFPLSARRFTMLWRSVCRACGGRRMVVAGGRRGRPHFILTAAGRGPSVFPVFTRMDRVAVGLVIPIATRSYGDRTNELVLDIT
jgi:hypothetical protein